VTSGQEIRAGDGGAGAGDLPAGFAVGQYRIERLLGRGGMGTVYAAEQPEIGARVAIKVLAAELSRDPRLVKRFVDEARAVNKIRHPNIIDIFAFGRLGDGRQYFVMEYLEGETLASRLERGPVAPTEARRLLLQICEALEAAHEEKIVHRDLKPENLWIAKPRHGQPYAKILDFGIAKLTEPWDASVATEVGVAMGTPHYMAPEQCRGEAIDHRVDIYAMGVILYVMWSGRLPFEGSTFLAVATQQITATPAPPSTHRPVPARLERLIMSCLEKDPAQRPLGARALRRELDQALEEALPGETLAGETPRTGAPAAAAPAAASALVARRGHRRAILVAVAVVVAVTSLGTVVAMRARSRSGAASAPVRPPQVEAVAKPVVARPPAAPVGAVAPPPSPQAGPPPSVKAPSPVSRSRLSPPRERERQPGASDTTPAERPPSRVEDRGFLKENPFR
jgi:serine/threonine-protein kinase